MEANIPAWRRFAVVFSCVLVMFTVWGMGNHPLSLYVVPITTAQGFSRASFALMFSVINLASAAGNLLFGRLVRGVGLWRMMAIGSALCIAAFGVLSLGGGLPVYYAGAALFGISAGFTTNSALPMVIDNWFQRNRGALIGLVFAASGVGGMLCDMLVGRLIGSIGYRGSLRVQWALVAVLLVIAMALLRERPPSPKAALRTVGAVPHETGDSVPASGAEAASSAGEPAARSALSTALRTRRFYLLAVTFALWGAAVTPMMTSIPAHMSDRGLDPVYVSGTVMAALFLFSAFAKFFMGLVADRIGPAVMIFLGAGGGLAAALLLPLIPGVPALSVSVAMGLGFASLSVPVPVLTSAVFGREGTAGFLGIFNASITLSGAVATPIVGAVFDRTGSYIPAFVVFAVLLALSIATGLLALRPAGRADTVS